jgi:hypothetical protein
MAHHIRERSILKYATPQNGRVVLRYETPHKGEGGTEI